MIQVTRGEEEFEREEALGQEQALGPEESVEILSTHTPKFKQITGKLAFPNTNM